ncbi:Predicted oxidoreductase [Devosia enhydra]|uniref:Predicted oxidoreductase n=1 Tax=Devosia enhydra TaxID=665118 RepID=A0A1K2HX01_9HYPH|nr:aldo/keto reductase [Devosia enhydra]SFZ83716.1 Predicted oxidoreductase [Devosia enhydra]
MNKRRLGKTGYEVSEIGLGCWQLGGDFGPVDDGTAYSILGRAADLGVNFWDTADVYGSGLSETRIGSFPRKAGVRVATKVGRGSALFPDKYTRQKLRENIEASLRRLGTERLDLVQLHCVPRPVLEDGEIFAWMDGLKRDGLVAHYGASVETIEEGMICLRHDGVSTLQIIFNLFRQDAAEDLLPAAAEKDVGIIVRLPLASGLLSGKYSATTAFTAHDHRHFNRDGQAFSVGETFSGIPFETGLALVDALRPVVPEGWPMSHLALRWILDHPGVSTIIAGVTRPDQLSDNVAAAGLPNLPEAYRFKLAEWYYEHVRPQVRGDI